jgi:hypothetical protein
MGGHGSTRWGHHEPAHTIEQARFLPIRYVVRDLASFAALGLLPWMEDWLGGIRCSVRSDDDGTPMSADVEYRIPFAWQTCELPIVSMVTAAGMRQYLWACPYEQDGEWCDRLVRTLYLPQDAVRFGCRHCHGLVYERDQSHDKNSDRREAIAHAHFQAFIARPSMRK